MLFASSTKSLLVAWFGAGASKGSPPAHRAEKSSHPSPSAPLAAPQGPLQQLHSHQQLCCTEKQSVSPFMFPFFLLFLHTSTTPSCKILSLSSSACLWWTYCTREIAEKYSVSFARKSLLPLEWTNLLQDGVQRALWSWGQSPHEPSSRTGMKILGRSRNRANCWKPSETWFNLACKPLCPEFIAKSETFSQIQELQNTLVCVFS